MSFSHPNTITVTFLPIKIKLKRGALTLLFMDMGGGGTVSNAVFNAALYNNHPVHEMLIRTTQDLPDVFSYLLDVSNRSPDWEYSHVRRI